MAKNSTFAEPHFRNDEAARVMLESILWPDGPVCPHCGVANHAYKTKRPGVFRCAPTYCMPYISRAAATISPARTCDRGSLRNGVAYTYREQHTADRYVD